MHAIYRALRLCKQGLRPTGLTVLLCLLLEPTADAQWSSDTQGPYTLSSVGIGQPAPGNVRLFVNTTDQNIGLYVRNLSSRSVTTYGLQAWASGGGTGTKIAIYGNASADRDYAGFFVGRGYFQGPLGIGVAPSSSRALVEIADLYPAGGRNLLIGNDAFFTDIDFANVLGLYGNQDSSRAALKLGSAGPLLSGFQGKLGVDVLEPAERLQLGDRFTFHDGGTKVLGLNFAFRSADVRLLQGGVATLRFGNDGSLKLLTAPSGPAGSVITYPGRGVLLTPEGRLGIGTDTPTEAVEVAGNLKLSGSIVTDGDICIGNCP